MKNLLLAGSTGYLGKHVLLHFLNEGYQISIIVNSKTKLYKIEYAINKVNIINIEDFDFIEKINKWKFDVFINAAVDYGYSSKNSSVLNCNVLQPLMIIDSLVDKENLVVITFDSFYSKNKFYDEIMQSRYTLSKKHLKEWLKFENKTSSMTTFILQLEHVIGPNESLDKFNGWIIDRLKSAPSIIELSDGQQIRDFILIFDILTAISLLINNSSKYIGENILINVGSGRGHTIKEFVELLHKKIKSNAILNFGALEYKKDDLMVSVANNEFLLSLGWRPNTNIEQIIDLVI
jgi:nucleoside-diphosphate-sugar epimerase